MSVPSTSIQVTLPYIDQRDARFELLRAAFHKKLHAEAEAQNEFKCQLHNPDDQGRSAENGADPSPQLNINPYEEVCVQREGELRTGICQVPEMQWGQVQAPLWDWLWSLPIDEMKVGSDNACIGPSAPKLREKWNPEKSCIGSGASKPSKRGNSEVVPDIASVEG